MYRTLFFILFSVALISAMSFPIQIGGIVYDLRSAAFAIGSLYGGTVVSFFLFLTVVIYRIFLDYPDTLIYAMSLAPSFVMVAVISRFFVTMKVYQKIITAVLLCTFIKALTFSVFFTLTSQMEVLFQDLENLAKTYLLQAFIAGICVYLLELINKYFQMHEELVSIEKQLIFSNMAASVAHEIRNPLTTVRGFIQFIGNENVESDKRSYYQNICIEELDRAERIISDYLSLAKPEPEVIDRIDIREEFQYLADILLSYAKDQKLDILCDIPPNRALYVMGDRYKFRQALINIGKNAVESMHQGGLLVISAKEESGNIVLAIRDTGMGMTAEQVRRLGTPYFSTKEKGTGLGTMVSFSIIKKMKGKIEINSTVGKGTEFVLRFPSASC